METIKDFKNELLQRREIKLILPSETTPSFEEAKALLEKEFKVKPESTIIKQVQGKFGRKTFLIEAWAYDSVEAMEKHTIKTQKQRKAEAEAAKKADEEKKKADEEAKAAAEKPAEETPAEEVKEAPKEDAKPEETKEENTEEKAE
jgi:ribosomal protein S24E